MDFVHPVEAVIPGTQGRVLAVLVGTTGEVNLRTIARLAGVSVAQCSRVMPRLVELGIVERREVPPSSLFRLARDHVVASALLGLARSRELVLDHLGRSASMLPLQPVTVAVFGSFARGEAGVDSDIDVLIVRPSEVDEDDDSWGAAIEGWRGQARSFAGNRVEILEVGRDEAAARLAGRSQLWSDIRRDGVVVHGLSVRELRVVTNA